MGTGWQVILFQELRYHTFWDTRERESSTAVCNDSVAAVGLGGIVVVALCSTIDYPEESK